MPVFVANRRTPRAALLARFPNAAVVDTTSQGEMPFRKLSPFYPHGYIPIPFSPGQYAESVEGIWQGLKVFSNSDIDVGKFTTLSMRGIKRSSRSYGAILGHRKGINGDELLGYTEAKRAIYIPSYLHVIERNLQTELGELAALASGSDLVLLDYNTAPNPLDPVKPISHAVLCKLHLEGVDLKSLCG